VHFPEEVVDAARKQIPLAWLAGAEPLVDALLFKLMSRCKRIAGPIRESQRRRINPPSPCYVQRCSATLRVGRV
jgi:hypothetical protein